MSTENTSKMRAVFTMAWQFVKRNGFTMSEALKQAWANVKLKIRMYEGIVKFHFRKVDGTVREAYGTLKTSLMPKTSPTGRKTPETVQTYYDTEKCAYRSFKRANLVIE